MQGTAPPFIHGVWAARSPQDVDPHTAQFLKSTSSTVSLSSHSLPQFGAVGVGEPNLPFYNGITNIQPQSMDVYKHRVHEINSHLPHKGIETTSSSLNRPSHEIYGHFFPDKQNTAGLNHATFDLFAPGKLKEVGNSQDNFRNVPELSTSMDAFSHLHLPRVGHSDLKTADSHGPTSEHSSGLSSYASTFPVPSVNREPSLSSHMKNLFSPVPSADKPFYETTSSAASDEKTSASSLYNGHAISTSTQIAEPVLSRHSSSLISYYSESREHSVNSIQNGLPLDKASKEAAKIVQLSQHADMRLKPDIHGGKIDSLYHTISKDSNRQQTSPFQPLDNIRAPSLHHPVPNRPGSSASLHSLDLRSPVDFRAENLFQKQTEPRPPSNTSIGSNGSNIWTQNYLAPPNMELSKPVMSYDKPGNKRLSSGSSQSDGIIKPPKKQKIHHMPEEISEPVAASLVPTNPLAAKDIPREKRRSPKGGNRRGSFSADPEIDAKVTENVQQIMAACRQINEANQHRKVQKQIKHPGLMAERSSKSPVSQVEPFWNTQLPFDMSAGHAAQPHLSNSSSDYGQQRELLSQQVMDMRVHRKDSVDVKNENRGQSHLGFPQERIPSRESLHSAFEPHKSMSLSEQINEVRTMKRQQSLEGTHGEKIPHEDIVKHALEGHPHFQSFSSLSHQVDQMRQQKHGQHLENVKYKDNQMNYSGGHAGDKSSLNQSMTHYPMSSGNSEQLLHNQVEQMRRRNSEHEQFQKQIQEMQNVNGEHVQHQQAHIRRMSMEHALSEQGVHGKKLDYGHQLYDQVESMRSKSSEHVHGRVSPCCGNCARLGVRNSLNCQNHKLHDFRQDVKQDTILDMSGSKAKFDPYSFPDDSKEPAKPLYKPRKFFSSAIGGADHENTFATKTGQLQQFPFKISGKMHKEIKSYEDKIDVKPKMQYPNIREFVKTEKTPKMKFATEKSQGLLQNKKSLSNKPYGIKSSNALLKRSYKYYQAKLPSVRQKWRNNPKYKKKPKDDFAENLIKNLGFPPLTLKDLVTKRSSLKLPKGYYNSHATIASSVLSAENKLDSRDRVSPASKPNESGTVAIESTDQQKQKWEPSEALKHLCKPIHRSKSLECSRTISGYDSPFLRSRSYSLDGWASSVKSKQQPLIAEGKQVIVNIDNKEARPYSSDDLQLVSAHVDKLRAKIFESPDSSFNTQNLENNTVIEVPKCGCLGPDVYSEAGEGPYYTHLGAGRSVEVIRKVLEERTGVVGAALRIEKLRYTGKEGKSSQGCPIAKWIIRRSNIEEKYLALVRHRTGHFCETAWIIIGLVAWEGVPMNQADDLYDFLCTTLPAHGNETERRCGTNDRKTCACQGADLMKRGASFSFGCSWSMYFNGCKFARSNHVRKFKLKSEHAEETLENKLQDLATHVGPLYKKCAPTAHANQSYFSSRAQDCRLGREEGGPFSGVTACVDFCAHAHKDIHNMNNGSTVVVTLTKHRGLSKPDDEQLHVLPLYVLEPTDEKGSYEGQYKKIQTGSLEVLHQYPLELRLRSQPLESCKKRRLAKKGQGKRGAFNGSYPGWDSSSSAQSTPQKSRENPYYKALQESNQSTPSQPGSVDSTPVKDSGRESDLSKDRPISYDDLMALSSQEGFHELHTKFWDYYNAYGVFPPPSFLRQKPLNPSHQNAPSHYNAHQPSAQPQDYSNQGQGRQHMDSHGTNMSHNQGSITEGTPNPHAVPLQSNLANGYHQLPENRSSVVVENPFSDISSGGHMQNVQSRGKFSDSSAGKYEFQSANKHGYENRSSSVESGQHLNNGVVDSYKSKSELPSNGCALDLSFSSTSSKQSSGGQMESCDRSVVERVLGDSKPGYKSPLDLLSQAVDMRSQSLGLDSKDPSSNHGTSQANIHNGNYHPSQSYGNFTSEIKEPYTGSAHAQQHQPYNHLSSQDTLSIAQYNHSQTNVFQTNNAQAVHRNGIVNQASHEFNRSEMNAQNGHVSQSEPTLLDPDIVKCQMEYNEDAFCDPDIGGVAVALCHGAVLFEVAKRELHATTGLRNPNRYHPTRISLVFYQHKNLNNEKHGMHAYEKKLEEMKMKRIEQMQLERGYVDMVEIENSFKGGKKRKASTDVSREEAEIEELLRHSKAEYRYMLDCSTGRVDSSTTNTVSTKWIDPSPVVTGPYQKWI